VQLKIRFADFQTITRAETLADPTNSTGELWQVASQILSTKLPGNHLAIRLLGVSVSGFEQSRQSQGLLFDQAEQQKLQQLDGVVDQIRDRFGGAAVRRASGIRGDDLGGQK
jgi:DNA polymerase IV